MKKPCYVILASCGNPDFGQHPDMEMFGAEPNRTVPISNFKEASIECKSFIHHNQLGSGNWIGGQILDENKEAFAYVSYNGRVWEGFANDWNSETKEIIIVK